MGRTIFSRAESRSFWSRRLGILLLTALQIPKRGFAAHLPAASCLAIVLFLPHSVFAETVFFVVSEIAQPCSACDSYVLPLSEPTDIAHARDLIANGPGIGGTIAMVDAVAGGDGINRNVVASGEPLWSWHVTSFQVFADVAIELCDGTPTFVEANPEAFLANTNGTLCFWGYTVSAEIEGGVEPLPVGGLIAPVIAVLISFAGMAYIAWRRASLPSARNESLP